MLSHATTSLLALLVLTASAPAQDPTPLALEGDSIGAIGLVMLPTQIASYRERGVLAEVDGMASIDEVEKRVEEALGAG